MEWKSKAFALAYYSGQVQVGKDWLVDSGGTEGKLEVMLVWTQVASVAAVAPAGPTAADTVVEAVPLATAGIGSD